MCPVCIREPVAPASRLTLTVEPLSIQFAVTVVSIWESLERIAFLNLRSVFPLAAIAFAKAVRSSSFIRDRSAMISARSTAILVIGSIDRSIFDLCRFMISKLTTRPGPCL